MEEKQKEEKLMDSDSKENMRYYKEAYERERQKSRVLAAKLADAEGRAADLEQKLGRIKGSIFWRLSKPLRSAVHWVQRTKERLGYYGSIKGVLRKLDAKRIEKKVRASHGTASFPGPEEAKRQRETVFPKKIKISILVPL